jgi:hypothetical protein
MTTQIASAEATSTPQHLAANLLRAEQLRLFDANMTSMLLGNALVAILLLGAQQAGGQVLRRACGFG